MVSTGSERRRATITFRTHEEWACRSDDYAHVPKEIRASGSLGVRLTHVDQPAGFYPVPATDEFRVQVAMSDHCRGRVDHGERSFRVDVARDLWVLSPDRVDCLYDLQDPLSLLSVVLPRCLVARAAEANHHGRSWRGDFDRLHHGLHDDQLVKALVLRLWREAAAGGVRGALFADQLIETLILTLQQQAYVEALPPPIRGGLAPHQVRAVEGHLRERLAEDVALRELAALVGLSPYHFARAFKQSTGLPPHAWLTERRMERARELMLGRPRMSLQDVALSVGYGSQTAFGAAFKRVVGVSPAEWRRQRGA